MTNLLFILALAFAQTQKPSTIEGTVTQFENGKPVSEAGVELSSIADNGATKYTTASAADGKFSFKNIPPGGYRLAATHAGYVRGEYGQRGPNSRGLVIGLTEGDEKKDLKIVLAATGSISGRIRDGNGNPLANVQVQALRHQYFNGQRTLAPVRVVITDDLGDYRAYWLPPGQYIVLAAPLRGEVGDEFITAAGANYSINSVLKSSIGRPIQLPDSETTTPFFFPGVIDPQAASIVDVKSGADLRGIDISLRAPRTFTIRGKVTNRTTPTPGAGPAGGPPPQVRLTPKDAPFSETFGTTIVGAIDRATGGFEIKGVSPGSYMLVSEAGGNYAFVPIDVSRDLEDVTLATVPGVEVSVRVTFDGDIAGTARPELAQLRVQAVAEGAARGQAAAPVPQQPPGNFSWRATPPIHLRLAFAGLPPSAYVKSAKLGPVDVLQDGFIADPANAGPMEIVLSPKGGTFMGTAVDARLTPLSNVTVVLVPNAPRRLRADLYKQASTNASGQFRISGIAPGDYKAFAWEDVPSSAWQHPDFIKLYENRGIPVHFEEGGSEGREITTIPAGQ